MSATTLNPSLNPALSPNAVPAPNPALAGTGAAAALGGGADSFSRLLEAADARRQPEPPSPPAAPARPSQGGTKPATATSALAAAERRGASREAGADKAAEAATDPATDEAKQAAAREAAAAAAGEDGRPDAAALLASLGLALRPAAEGGTARGRGRAGGETEAATEAATGLTGTTPRRGPGGCGIGDASDDQHGLKRFEGLLAQAGKAEAEATGALEQAALAPVAAELPPAEGAAALAPGAGLAGPAALAGVLAGAPAVPGTSASQPAEARLAHSPGSPAFAGELGAQISTFVREGVQHARLQLHPLELGPVTVQIQLDGGSAHMSFAAEHALTRQALEQALPTLASSLREAGLTLSGGGVFEQPRQPQPGSDGQPGASGGGERGNARAGSGGEAAGPLPASATEAARRRGVVDLVA